MLENIGQVSFTLHGSFKVQQLLKRKHKIDKQTNCSLFSANGVSFQAFIKLIQNTISLNIFRLLPRVLLRTILLNNLYIYQHPTPTPTPTCLALFSLLKLRLMSRCMTKHLACLTLSMNGGGDLHERLCCGDAALKLFILKTASHNGFIMDSCQTQTASTIQPPAVTCDRLSVYFREPRLESLSCECG